MTTAVEYRTTLDQMIAKIRRDIADRIYLDDLLRMATAVSDSITQLSKEEVQCRGRGKETPLYQRLQQEVQSGIENLEQHHLIAILSKTH